MPTLASLHWPPITARFGYKVALLTFKTLTTGRPSYLHKLYSFIGQLGYLARMNR